MRIATFNTFEGGNTRLGAVGGREKLILKVVRDIAPDLVTLQELVGWERAGRARFESFARATGLVGEIFVGGGYPMGLLVREPWKMIAARFLHEGFWHGLIFAELGNPDGRRLQVLAAHLSPRGPRQRLDELSIALAAIDPAVPTVLLGDLNLLSHIDRLESCDVSLPTFIRHSSAGRLDQRVSRRLAGLGLVDAFAHLHPGCRGHTIPTPAAPESPFSAARLDYVHLSAPLLARLRTAAVYRSAPAESASDHYPLVVELDC